MASFTVKDLVEELAHIIDPEAFGLPNNAEPDTLTDRDEARDRARLILAWLREHEKTRADFSGGRSNQV